MTTTDDGSEKAFPWRQLWGIEGKPGEFDVGDIVLVEKRDGTATHHMVACVVEYTTSAVTSGCGR